MKLKKKKREPELVQKGVDTNIHLRDGLVRVYQNMYYLGDKLVIITEVSTINKHTGMYQFHCGDSQTYLISEDT